MGLSCFRSRDSQTPRGTRDGTTTTTTILRPQQEQAQRQIEAQQRQIEALQQQKFQQTQQPQSQQEDIQAKLLKYADLHQKGVLTDEEFQKLKADLLAKI